MDLPYLCFFSQSYEKIKMRSNILERNPSLLCCNAYQLAYKSSYFSRFYNINELLVVINVIIFVALYCNAYRLQTTTNLKMYSFFHQLNNVYKCKYTVYIMYLDFLDTHIRMVLLKFCQSSFGLISKSFVKCEQYSYQYRETNCKFELFG